MSDLHDARVEAAVDEYLKIHLDEAGRPSIRESMRAALAAADAVSSKELSMSPERDKKEADSLHEARVEAAAKAMYELRAKIDDPFWEGGKLDYGIKQIYRQDARAALAAADAVCCKHLKCPGGSLCCCRNDAMVTVEQIAEVIMRALVFTNENSKPWADGVARDVRALFGEVAGDE